MAASKQKSFLTITTLNTVGNLTYSAAQIRTGLIVRDPNGGGRTDTTDTAARLIQELGLHQEGDAWVCYLINTADAAETITLAGGTGVTISNVAQTVAQNEAAEMLFVRTNDGGITLYLIGA